MNIKFDSIQMARSLVLVVLLSPFVFIAGDFILETHYNYTYSKKIGVLPRKEALNKAITMNGLTPLESFNLAQKRLNEICEENGWPTRSLQQHQFFVTNKGEYFFPLAWGKWVRIGPMVCDRGGFYVNPMNRNINYIDPYTADYQTEYRIPWSYGVNYADLPER